MHVNTGRLARGFAWVVTGPVRYLIVVLWVAAAVASVRFLPGIAGATQGSSGLLAPKNAPAIIAEERSVRLFAFPLLGRTVMVQRDAHGLSSNAQARVVERAAAIDRRGGRDRSGVAAALPIINNPAIAPFARERSTTALTYFFFQPWRGIFDQYHTSERYASSHVNGRADHLIGLTGIVPARVTESGIIADKLALVEIATVVLIAIVVGLTFRSLGAPVVTLVAAGIAYLVAVHVLGYVARRSGTSIPVELEPILVVLILAVCTDYAVFFLSGTRRNLQGGEARIAAARVAAAEFVPIIVTAGLTIVGCTASLMLAQLDFLQALGPALAIGVAMALVVAITLVPACLAIAGRVVFWPGLANKVYPRSQREPAAWRTSVARWISRNWPAALAAAVICTAGLVAAASGLGRMGLGLPLLSDLPATTQTARATRAAAQGFVPGMLSPTVILIDQSAILDHQAQLARLEVALARQPGVAAVVGPRERLRAIPSVAPALADLKGLLERRLGVSGGQLSVHRAYGAVFSKNGSTARMVLVLRPDPLGARAIADLGTIERRMPALLRQVGLPHARASYAGDTALAKETIDGLVGSMIPVGAAIAAIIFVSLALLLRSLIAPLYLLAASGLAATAPLGLTVYLFQYELGQSYLAYYAPLGAGVLLIALGSDYNLFVVGRVWEEARNRPLRAAIAVAVPRATGAITTAAITLAASFALLALVPLTSFREFAFAMVAGVLIDAFVVRSYLVTALMSLFGRFSFWPRQPDKPAS